METTPWLDLRESNSPNEPHTRAQRITRVQETYFIWSSNNGECHSYHSWSPPEKFRERQSLEYSKGMKTALVSLDLGLWKLQYSPCMQGKPFEEGFHSYKREIGRNCPEVFQLAIIMWKRKTRIEILGLMYSGFAAPEDNLDSASRIGVFADKTNWPKINNFLSSCLIEQAVHCKLEIGI